MWHRIVWPWQGPMLYCHLAGIAPEGVLQSRKLQLQLSKEVAPLHVSFGPHVWTRYGDPLTVPIDIWMMASDRVVVS